MTDAVAEGALGAIATTVQVTARALRRWVGPSPTPAPAPSTKTATTAPADVSAPAVTPAVETGGAAACVASVERAVSNRRDEYWEHVSILGRRGPMTGAALLNEVTLFLSVGRFFKINFSSLPITLNQNTKMTSNGLECESGLGLGFCLLGARGAREEAN